MNALATILGLSLLMSGSGAVAAAPDCTPVISKPWIRSAPAGTTMLAGYADVANPCPGPIAIVGVESPDFARSMIHETVVQKGMSRMRHAPSLALPAKGKLSFEPGGRHLMLMHPRRALKVGDKVRVRLQLADGRRVDAFFSVRRDAPN